MASSVVSGTGLILFDTLLIGVFAALVWKTVRVTRKGYGTTYTSAIPYFLLGFGLILLQSLVEAGFEYVLAGSPALSPPFTISLQAIQLMSGLFLIRGMYQVYNIYYGTEGFEVSRDGE